MADRVRGKVLSILQHHEPMPISALAEANLREIVRQAEERHKG
jgi:hypothetical protein